MKKRRRRLRHLRLLLTVSQVLAWADHEFQKTGHWPSCTGERVLADRTETWRNIDVALRLGFRGLPKGSSLARLLSEHRGVRNHRRLPRLTVARILTWADHEFQKTGHWPRCTDQEVLADATENWQRIDSALRHGCRGLTAGSSLPQLLASHRGARNHRALPPLTETQIVAWAEAHFRRTGEWPKYQSAGAVAEAPGQTWQAINSALQQGLRGLPGGDTLAKLLARRFGIRNRTYSRGAYREKDSGTRRRVPVSRGVISDAEEKKTHRASRTPTHVGHDNK